MPRYHFDVHNGIDIYDEIGRDLVGIEAAKIEAMRIATGFATNPKMLGENGGTIVITIRDASDGVACTIRLKYTVGNV